MKKIYSLIKASLSEGMSLFKLKQIDKQSNIRKKLFPNVKTYFKTNISSSTLELKFELIL